MDEKMRQEIALHRWAVIAEAASARLTASERGAVVRQIAAREHAHPDGTRRRYSRGTVDRWLRAWRTGGVDGLRPSPRSDTGKVRAMPELFTEKQERLNRYIREAFLAEACHHGIESLEQLNDLFAAWAGQVANRRVHAGTGQAPIDRFTAGGPHRQAPDAVLADAFRWSVTRRVTRVATVPLEGNSYSADPALTGLAHRVAVRPGEHGQDRRVPGRQAGRGRGPVHHRPSRAQGGRPAAGAAG